MKLLYVCMFHRIGCGEYANDFETFQKQLEYFDSIGHFTLPGNALKNGNNFCLTFDDATIDFYQVVFPFLKRSKIPSVLAVPVEYIENQEEENRSYCSWDELLEMSQSPYVEIASHSMTHANLKECDNLSYEIEDSKNILEDRLETTVSTFVYPYGKMTSSIQKEVQKRYRYALRIGNSINFSWRHLLYRIPCDNLTSIHSTTARSRLFLYCFNFIKNKVRRR